jgi:hypothetical protein
MNDSPELLRCQYSNRKAVVAPPHKHDRIAQMLQKNKMTTPRLPGLFS